MTILVTATSDRCEEGEEGCRMEYQWLAGHDPIRIDSNLAHIDFDDFKNEDLQHAFEYSVQSIDGESSSGTDMSICKSEQLFSSFKEMPGEAESIIQDSLTQEDFYTHQVKPNKNAYTLTYSGVGTSIHQEQYPNSGSLPDDGKYTTWSNVMKQKGGVQVPRPPGEEENNNMADSNRKSRSLPNISKRLVRVAWTEEDKHSRESSAEEPKLLDLYMRGRADRNSWNGEGLDDAGYRADQSTSPDPRTGYPVSPDQGQAMAKEKDAINEYLRKSRLSSIDERVEAHSSSSSGDENTVRPVPTPRQRSVTSMSTSPSVQGTSLNSGPTLSSLATPPYHTSSGTLPLHGSRSSSASLSLSTPKRRNNFPDLDFLEEDCALWDAFFTNKKTGGKHSSVLTSQAPVEDYLRRAGSAAVKDVSSLRVLLPGTQQHLLKTKKTKSPLSQVCESLSRLNSSQYNNVDNKELEAQEPVEVVKVKEAWAPQLEQIQGYFKNFERGCGDDLNLNNNNEESRRGRQQRRHSQQRSGSGSVERSAERAEKSVKRRSYHPQDGLSQLLMSPGDELKLKSRRAQPFPKSGSQGNLCDSWAEGELPSNSSSQTKSGGVKDRSISAEYPFIPSLSFPNQNINFDLTHKRGLFVNLYTAVERLLLFQDPSPSYSNRSAARCVLLHEFCPALHAILEDGLKEEVITSFGRMKTSVWRVIEAIMQAGPAQRATCDLVMLLNTKFSSEEDFKKFSGFVIGMLNMSSLHLWFSKLKWSMDVLVRFYQRHAFICALHKETKLLLDELVFCLQRLFSLPFHIDMPFNSGILEEIPGGEIYKKREHCSNCACSRTTSQNSSAPTTPGSGSSSGRSSRSSRSRIPRPISLPKRLEEKLSSATRSPARAVSQGNPTRGGQDPKLKSPLKPHPPPRPKSRVRDTIRLFDAKYKPGSGKKAPASKTRPVTSPKTGGGEGMAGDSMEDKFK